MNSRLIVSSVIEKGDFLLFGKKRKNIGPYPNTWHLIGGGVELGKESCKEAMLREIKEEAGIKVRIIKPISFDEDYEKDKHGVLTHYVFLVYKAKYLSGKIKADDDIKQLRWFPKSQLKKIKLNKPSKRLFKLMSYLKSK